MSARTPTTRTMAIDELEGELDDLIGQIARQETRVMIEDGGVPVVALVSPVDLARLDRFDQERAERWRVVDRTREAFRGVPTEEIEREAAKAVAEVRSEMAAERESAAATT